MPAHSSTFLPDFLHTCHNRSKSLGHSTHPPPAVSIFLFLLSRSSSPPLLLSPRLPPPPTPPPLLFVRFPRLRDFVSPPPKSPPGVAVENTQQRSPDSSSKAKENPPEGVGELLA